MIHHLNLAASQQNPLIPDLAELIIGAIAFVIVFAILYRVLLPRIATTLEERTDAIEGGLKRAEDAQAEANRVLEDVPGAAGRGPARSLAAARGGQGGRRRDPRRAPRAGRGRAPAPGRGRARAARRRPPAGHQRAAGRGRLARGGAGRPDRRGVPGGRGPAAPDGGELPRRAGRAVRADHRGQGPVMRGASRASLAEAAEALQAAAGRRGATRAGSATSCSR